jgi:hypothetical protein
MIFVDISYEGCDVMDIAGYSMLSSQMKIASQVSLAVAKLAKDTATDNATEFVKLLEQSVQPGKGASIDIKV